MKKSTKVLHYFVLDCGMLEFLQIFFSQAVIQRTIVDLPHFGDWFCGKDFGLCTYNTCAEHEGGLEAFLYEADQNFEVF